MPDLSYVPLSTLRQDVKNLAERFDRSQTYDNALALQKACRALEAFFKDERRCFMVLHNPNPIVVRAEHVPPAHWRVINGGRNGSV